MDYYPKAKSRKGLISMTWERCKSFSGSIGRKGSSANQQALKMKSKSCSHGLAAPNQEKKNVKKWSEVAPEGCFSIYVGPQKQRFMIKTEYVNHPLFRVLLEEAESEYGYSSEGPLVLPCGVDHFIKVLMAMDCDDDIGKHKRCNLVARSYSSYHLLAPPRFVAMNDFKQWASFRTAN